MGQIRHGSARTTEASWRVMRPGQESPMDLAARYKTNEKTVAKWRTRGFAHEVSVQSHSHSFLTAYNCARRLKTLKGMSS